MLEVVEAKATMVSAIVVLHESFQLLVVAAKAFAFVLASSWAYRWAFHLVLSASCLAFRILAEAFEPSIAS